MRKALRIITDNKTLRARYDALAAGDCVIGRVRLKPSEEYMLVDLLERGVRFFPSAVAQIASRSKSFQVRLFSSYMAPNTRALHDIHQLREAMNAYAREDVGQVVTKRDRANAGTGIHLWRSVEEVYSHASLGILPFPFVLQPFVANCRDIRVVVLADYAEAYVRDNPHNFRKNLHFGGASEPCTLDAAQWSLCRDVMARGKFPYAHLDLLALPAGETYLTEINLRGGIRGARISPQEYKARIEAIHEKAGREGRP